MTEVTADSRLVAGLREDLVVALRTAAQHGMNEGIDNHFSAAVPATSTFLINRYGPDWSELAPADILLVDASGAVVDGAGTYDLSAFTIHRHMHAARPDAAVVFHTHMLGATAVALTEQGLSTRLSQAGMYFHGTVATVDYNGFVDADEEGLRLCAAISHDTDVVLMRNHGVMVLAPTVAHAWHRLYFLERAARLQVVATSQGVPLVEVSEAVARRTCSQWRVLEGDIAEALFASVRQGVARTAVGPNTPIERLATGPGPASS